MGKHAKSVVRIKEIKEQLAAIKNNWVDDILYVLREDPRISDREKAQLKRSKIDAVVHGYLKNPLWVEYIEDAMVFTLKHYEKERDSFQQKVSRLYSKIREAV